jgi:hypothetical protein
VTYGRAESWNFAPLKIFNHQLNRALLEYGNLSWNRDCRSRTVQCQAMPVPSSFPPPTTSLLSTSLANSERMAFYLVLLPRSLDLCRRLCRLCMLYRLLQALRPARWALLAPCAAAFATRSWSNKAAENHVTIRGSF